MNRRTDRETDGQGDFLYIPNFCLRGIECKIAMDKNHFAFINFLYSILTLELSTGTYYFLFEIIIIYIRRVL